jgi:hypothetical protein
MSNKPAPKLEDKLCGMLRPVAGGEDGGVEVVVPLFEPETRPWSWMRRSLSVKAALNVVRTVLCAACRRLSVSFLE